MNATASTNMAGGLLALIGTFGLSMGHMSANNHLVMMITIVVMATISHVLRKFK